MGEVKGESLLFYFSVSLVLILFALGLKGEIRFLNNGDFETHSKTGNSLSGYAIHEKYSAYSSPVSIHSFEKTSGFLSIEDNIIYKTGYYSVNGEAWVQFGLSGNYIEGNNLWLENYAESSLPIFGEGEHYVIIYSCILSSSSWECHDNKWQLIIVNNTPASIPQTNTSEQTELDTTTTNPTNTSISTNTTTNTTNTTNTTDTKNTTETNLPPEDTFSEIEIQTCTGSTTQSCYIPNGTGQQSRTCNNGVWSSWSSCIVDSCNTGYNISGNTCVPLTCVGSTTQACYVQNGVGSQNRTCTNGVWSSWSTCTVTSCNTGYYISGNSCLQNTPAPTCTDGIKNGDETGIDCGGVCTACYTAPTILPANYYVSTTGSDSNSGTATAPFKTWQKAVNTAKAGDLIYIRGGIYTTTGAYASGSTNGVNVAGKSGTSTNKINLFAYPGEVPILDCSGIQASGLRTCLNFENSNYWHLKGLTFRNTQAYQSGAWSTVGVDITSSSNNIFENIVSYGHSGPGITIAGDNNLFLNCDSHSNKDQLASGEHADGFILGKNTNRYTNTFRGCRAYNNSDDGFDSYGFEGTVIFENCWSFDNGFGTTAGDGAGFKLGMMTMASTGSPQRILKNCIASGNDLEGFDQGESLYATVKIENSVAYNCKSVGFLFNNGGNVASVFTNNIAYKNTYSHTFLSNNIQKTNSWQVASVSDADFVSLDASQLYRQRKSDGSLPDVTFLHLRSDSDMIDKGTNIGSSYLGTAPDLGPFESR
jgi:hypothetical protein